MRVDIGTEWGESLWFPRTSQSGLIACRQQSVHKEEGNAGRGDGAKKRLWTSQIVRWSERKRDWEGEDGMKVSWGKVAGKYEDTLERREQINKGCFPWIKHDFKRRLGRGPHTQLLFTGQHNTPPHDPGGTPNINHTVCPGPSALSSYLYLPPPGRFVVCRAVCLPGKPSCSLVVEEVLSLYKTSGDKLDLAESSVFEFASNFIQSFLSRLLLHQL